MAQSNPPLPPPPLKTDPLELVEAVLSNLNNEGAGPVVRSERQV